MMADFLVGLLLGALGGSVLAAVLIGQQTYGDEDYNPRYTQCIALENPPVMRCIEADDPKFFAQQPEQQR